MDCSTPGFPITSSQTVLKLMSIRSVMTSNHLILCCPLLLLPSIFPSIRVFSSESALRIRWPNYWSFSFSISPPSEYSGLISFRMNWLDLLAVQGPLKSLLQHHRSKASILRCSLLPSSIFPSTGVFSNESVLHIRCPKYWSLIFSISPSYEYSGLMSFRIDWFDLAVQGTLKSLPQHHSSKASIFQHSSLFNSLTLTSIHDYWENHTF